MRNNTHNYIAKTAIDYANIQPEEIMDICLREEGALVEVDFNTEWMNYICIRRPERRSARLPLRACAHPRYRHDGAVHPGPPLCVTDSLFFSTE